jgi:hypothetical protein
MRETRQSGLEGGVRLIPHPYPYRRSPGLRLAQPQRVVTPVAIGIATPIRPRLRTRCG